MDLSLLGGQAKSSSQDLTGNSKVEMTDNSFVVAPLSSVDPSVQRMHCTLYCKRRKSGFFSGFAAMLHTASNDMDVTISKIVISSATLGVAKFAFGIYPDSNVTWEANPFFEHLHNPKSKSPAKFLVDGMIKGDSSPVVIENPETFRFNIGETPILAYGISLCGCRLKFVFYPEGCAASGSSMTVRYGKVKNRVTWLTSLTERSFSVRVVKY